MKVFVPQDPEPSLSGANKSIRSRLSDAQACLTVQSLWLYADALRDVGRTEERTAILAALKGLLIERLKAMPDLSAFSDLVRASQQPESLSNDDDLDEGDEPEIQARLEDLTVEELWPSVLFRLKDEIPVPDDFKRFLS